MALSCFAGCKISINKEEKSIAANNAVSYIEEKYGFTPKVKKVEEKMLSNALFPSVSRFALVTMSYKGDEFEVYAKWEEETIDEACDNYQWEDFIDELTETVEDKLDCVDYEINITIPYLDISISDYDDLIESSYEVVVDVLTYGLTYNCYHQLYNYFLGDHFTFILRDYIDNDLPSWDDVSLDFIASSEYIDLRYSVEFSYGNEERHEYEHTYLDGITAVYDVSQEVTFESFSMDYSFIETHSNYGYEYPFDAYHISCRPDSRIYLYFEPDEASQGYNSYLYDGWIVFSDGSSIRDTSIKIDDGPHSGSQVIVLRIEVSSFDLGIVKRSYSV